MSATPAPAPWTFRANWILCGDGRGIARLEDGFYTAIDAPPWWKGDYDSIDGPYRGERQEANARLVAAAPDLLAACEAAEGWIPFENDDVRVALRAAIARARGEAS